MNELLITCINPRSNHRYNLHKLTNSKILRLVEFVDFVEWQKQNCLFGLLLVKCYFSVFQTIVFLFAALTVDFIVLLLGGM